MAEKMGILGRKLGMTRIFARRRCARHGDSGRALPRHPGEDR